MCVRVPTCSPAHVSMGMNVCTATCLRIYCVCAHVLGHACTCVHAYTPGCEFLHAWACLLAHARTFLGTGAHLCILCARARAFGITCMHTFAQVHVPPWQCLQVHLCACGSVCAQQCPRALHTHTCPRAHFSTHLSTSVVRCLREAGVLGPGTRFSGRFSLPWHPARPPTLLPAPPSQAHRSRTRRGSQS